ncbi:MAG: autotransporter domain-containing protein [Pontiellaceae bacterium]|nr:autotransporter domain-containing protein [Pontiellaceae bacterium]MBN2784261.1 autotransporter domain-containing protein [Pontiellaceae bacterium]
MKRIFMMSAVGMLCTAGAFAQYTNVLEGGTEQVISNAWTVGAVTIGGTTSSNTLNVVSNGVISSGDVYIGATNTYYNEVSLSQTGLWNVAGSVVLESGSGNNLSITDGALLTADHVALHSYNTLTLGTDGSISNLQSMSVYSNAVISGSGTIAFGTNDALLAFYGEDQTLSSGILFSANSNFNNTLSFTDGTLDVSGFDPAQYENFGNLVLSGSTLTGSGTLDSFGTLSMTGGMIDPAGDSTGILTLGGAFTSTGTTYRAQVESLTASDEIIFSGAGAIDLSGLLLDIEVSGSTTGAVTILSAAGGLTNDFSNTAIVSRPLLFNASLQTVSNEVQVVLSAIDSSTAQISSQLGFAATESVRAGFGGMKNTVFTRTKQLRRNLVSTPMSIANDVLLMTSTNAPDGAMGPGDHNTIFDMHVWLQQYSGQGDYDRIGVSDAFKLNNSGTTIGADRLIGDSLAVGLNYTYARSAARADGGDRLDSETYWIGAYAEWIDPEGLYIDGLVAYGYTDYNAERFASSYHGTASYSGQSLGASADVGQYYYAEGIALSPYMGLHALTMMVDDHTETEAGGSRMQVAGVDRSWLESAIGMKFRHRFDTSIGRFQTTGYGEWTYDFIQDDVSAQLSSGASTVNTVQISPDESGINTGIGFSWICTEYLEVGIGYNGRFSDHYEEHTGSIMIDTMF